MARATVKTAAISSQRQINNDLCLGEKTNPSLLSLIGGILPNEP
jgi:hypothetical protein